MMPVNILKLYHAICTCIKLCRLLSYVHCCKDQNKICSWTTSEEMVCSRLSCGAEALSLLKTGFKVASHMSILHTRCDTLICSLTWSGRAALGETAQSCADWQV